MKPPKHHQPYSDAELGLILMTPRTNGFLEGLALFLGRTPKAIGWAWRFSSSNSSTARARDNTFLKQVRRVQKQLGLKPF
jgi:hypothetical protein